MSETDDTDDLLLIPPDFFAVHSQPEPLYYSIVDTLIKQVSNLQNRIEGIESMSDVSSYLDTDMFNQPTKRHFSHEDLSRTPPRVLEKQISSLPNTPLTHNFRSRVKFNTPEKVINGDEPVLQEIDTFISNVKTIQRNQAVRNLENDFSRVPRETQKNLSRQRLNKNNTEVNNPQAQNQTYFHRSTVPGKSKNNDMTQEEKLNRVRTWQCGDSVPDYGSGSTKSLDKSSDSSSESTQMTAYRNEGQNKLDYAQERMDQERNELLQSPLHENALTILNMHKQLSENVKQRPIHKKRTVYTLSDGLGLMSLADIWNSAQVPPSPNKLSQKLQEEKLRRHHCEQLIQELQSKNLELQQKITVALKVDESKNKTVQHCREALDKLSEQIESLNNEKLTWEQDISMVKSQFAVDIEAANRKVSYYEKEASKSLNLAHNNQEKLNKLEKTCAELENQLQQSKVRWQEAQDNFDKELLKNKQLADILTQKELELKENKSVLNVARDEVSHSRKAVEVCQMEFTALKGECDRLQNDLTESKSIILTLREENKQLNDDIQLYRQNEKGLKEALEHLKTKLDNCKVELMNFYQGQLEIIVENKRKEMQQQLDQQKQAHADELKRKELSMAKTAANHIKEMSEKCALETKLLEQKHAEEMRLYQMRLSRAQKEMDKRTEMARQVQKVMETQWQQVLKMISASPVASPPFRDAVGNGHEDAQKVAPEYDETPVSSRGQKQSESEIQKYINMLLNRAPGNPIEEPQDTRIITKTTLNPTHHDETQQNRPTSKEQKQDKRPWK